MADDKPTDVTPPELTQPTVKGPTVDGHPREGESRDPKGRRGKGVPQPAIQPPTHAKYAVSPGSVNDAGNEILSRSQQSVNTYEDLKSTVQHDGGWIFWEPAIGTKIPDIMGVEGGYVTDQSPETTNQLTAAEDNLLLGVADSITLAGQFADQLNNAAQFYTQADKASVLPEMPFTIGAGSIMGQPPKPDATGTPADSPKNDGSG